MSVEERLVHALGRTDRVEPSPDLWSRVVHSIEEDRTHRRRIVQTAIGGVALAAALVVVGGLAMVDGLAGRHVRWQVMELLEVFVLVAMILALGPGIRRFGRGYASDLFTSDRRLGASVLRLLDLAYFLVFGGYVLLSVDFPDRFDQVRLALAGQLADAAGRLGGLLLVMGILHAVTLAALPLMALVHNSNRTARRLPRWIWVIVVLGGIAVWQLSGLVLVLIGAE